MKTIKTADVLRRVNLDTRPFLVQLEEAEKFFDDPSLPPSASDKPYADKDGLVEFICGNELLNDPVAVEKMTALKKTLISLLSIVTDYVNRYAEKYGAEYKTDPEKWEEVVSHLPLMGGSKIDRQQYSRNIKGVQIATDFISMILDVATDQGAGLDTFKKFLQNQGEFLRAGVEENKDSYHTIVLGVTVEAFKFGEEIIYIPKIKQYRVDFTRENSVFSLHCASYEKVVMDFNYQYAVNVFDYEALEDEEIKKKLDDFIHKSRSAQIDESETFFDEDFD